MTARSQRRAEERKRKKALKPLPTDPTKVGVAPASPVSSEESRKLEDQIPPSAKQDGPVKASAAQRSTNQQNSQHSTGPRTAEGKAKSSRNSFSHGLSGTGFCLLSYESQDEYDALEAEFLAEHAPATLTEMLLVRKLSQSWWLRQRAQRMTDMTFPDANGGTCIEILPLYMRYQAHHDRAFHKA